MFSLLKPQILGLGLIPHPVHKRWDIVTMPGIPLSAGHLLAVGWLYNFCYETWLLLCQPPSSESGTEAEMEPELNLSLWCLAGIDIHFIHVKPPYVPHGRAVQPILMVHGWPGSFYEFYKIIPLLTEPARYGLGDGDVVFEVICPSIPGYGFSEAPHQKGKWWRSSTRTTRFLV